MNIEESIEYLKNYKYDNEVRQAIETLLTAYEKEKEEHKKECHNCDEYTARLGELETENRMLKSELEQEKEKNKDMSCDLTETRADNIDESTMLKQIKLKLQEKNIPIETLLAEFERLEDLEDDLTTVYLNGVYDGEKKVKDKIKAKIEELEKANNYNGKHTKGADNI